MVLQGATNVRRKGKIIRFGVSGIIYKEGKEFLALLASCTSRGWGVLSLVWWVLLGGGGSGAPWDIEYCCDFSCRECCERFGGREGECC